MSLAEKIEKIRVWLRYHGDYHVDIDLWDLYGTVGVEISHHSEVVKRFRGEHFEKRLDEILLYFKYLDQLTIEAIQEAQRKEQEG